MSRQEKGNVEGPYSELKDKSVHYGKGVVGPSAEDVNRANSFVSDERGSTTTKVAIGVGAAVAALGGVGYMATHQEAPPAIVRTEKPSAAAASPTPKESASPVVIKTPEPSKSPEVQAVPCIILSPELCAQAELLSYKNSQGQELKYMGWNLPAGTPIFSPIDGQYTKATISQPSPFQGLLVGINPPDHSVNYNFTGDIQVIENINVLSGKTMGTIANTGAKEFGKYNLIFTITHIDSITKRPVVDEETLKKLFPKAFEKTPTQVSYTGPNPVITVTSPEYYTNKP